MSRGEFKSNKLLTMFAQDREWEYENDHYYMLLRELILKRLDISYYLKWISTHCNAYMIHESEYSTAYKAFFMLETEKNKDRILEIVSTEEGVTERDLRLAGALLGAYCG